MSDLMQKLKNDGGYILAKDLDEMISELGEDFKVWVVYYSYPITLMSLKDLKLLKESKSEDSEDIKQVYMVAETYREMFCRYGNGF